MAAAPNSEHTRCSAGAEKKALCCLASPGLKKDNQSKSCSSKYLISILKNIEISIMLLKCSWILKHSCREVASSPFRGFCNVSVCLNITVCYINAFALSLMAFCRATNISQSQVILCTTLNRGQVISKLLTRSITASTLTRMMLGQRLASASPDTEGLLWTASGTGRAWLSPGSLDLPTT